MPQGARGRQKPFGHIFGIKARLKRMAGDLQIFLRHWQRLARRHAQLPLDQIDAGDQFRHRMLDLQAGVHLHEPKPILAQPTRAIDDKFNRAGTGIANRLGRAHRRAPHRLAHRLGHAGGRRLFDHLLMAALQTAIALEQMHRAMTITKNLHFDMARLFDIFLDQHSRVAKGALRLALGTGQSIGKCLGTCDQPHALATAPGHRLDQHRIANLGRALGQKRRRLLGPMIARHHRHARLLHQRLGGIF